MTIKYHYTVDPCPTCGQTVDTIETTNMWGSGVHCKVGPCNHAVKVSQTVDNSNDIQQVHMSFQPAPEGSGFAVGGFLSAEQYKYANYGYNGGGSQSIVNELSRVVPALDTYTTMCPEPECALNGYSKGTYLSALIPHVNDVHRWSRERIADWLETLDVDLTIQPKGKHDDADTGTEVAEITGQAAGGLICYPNSNIPILI